MNPKAACLKRREEEKVEEEAPEKRAVPGVDKPFDTPGAAAARGRGRRGRRSSRGEWVLFPLRERMMEQKSNLKALTGICEFQLSYF